MVSKVKDVRQKQFYAAPGPIMVVTGFKAHHSFTTSNPKRKHHKFRQNSFLIEATEVDPKVDFRQKTMSPKDPIASPMGEFNQRFCFRASCIIWMRFGGIERRRLPPMADKEYLNYWRAKLLNPGYCIFRFTCGEAWYQRPRCKRLPVNKPHRRADSVGALD
jgi:hypothetical protein